MEMIALPVQKAVMRAGLGRVHGVCGCAGPVAPGTAYNWSGGLGMLCQLINWISDHRRLGFTFAVWPDVWELDDTFLTVYLPTYSSLKETDSSGFI